MNEKELSLLMPEDNLLNSWQLCVKNAILSIQADRLSYDPSWGSKPDNIHSGCTKDRMKGQSRIMRAGNPRLSYCCGAVMEVFMEAWENWKGRSHHDFNVAQWRELYAQTFLFEREDWSTEYGIMGGIAYLASQNEWLKADYSEEPDIFPFGAFVQMRYKENPYTPNSGHTVVVLGHGQKDGKDCLVVWSSNYGHNGHFEYDRETGIYTVSDGDAQPNGHGPDFYLKDRVKDGYRRRFFGAWINP